MVTLIVAVSRNGVIGNRGQIPWKLSEDLRYFKATTMGHVLVMGRKTYESIGRPLPGRDTIVLSRGHWYSSGAAALTPPGAGTVTTARSLREVLTWSDRKSPTRYHGREIFLCGGEAVYREALERNFVDKMLITRVDQDFEGDAHFAEDAIDDSRMVLSMIVMPNATKDYYTVEMSERAPVVLPRLGAAPPGVESAWWREVWERRR